MNLCSNEYFVILSRGFVVYTKRYFGAQFTCVVFKFYFLKVVIVFLIIFFGVGCSTEKIFMELSPPLNSIWDLKNPVYFLRMFTFS